MVWYLDVRDRVDGREGRLRFSVERRVKKPHVGRFGLQVEVPIEKLVRKNISRESHL